MRTALTRPSELVLLDTGVLVSDELQLDPTTRTTVAALTFAELEFGVSAAAIRGDALEVRRRSARLATAHAKYGEGLPFDGAAAIAYGTITTAVLRHGRNPRARSVDLLIAAVALSRGAVLVTTQPGEFAGLDDVMEIRGTDHG